jgi:hypothetical protein
MATPPDTFFAVFTEEAHRLVPLNYRLLQPPPRTSIGKIRLAESTAYRSPQYICEHFYKPISRCFRVPGESAHPSAEGPGACHHPRGA